MFILHGTILASYFFILKPTKKIQNVDSIQILIKGGWSRGGEFYLSLPKENNESLYLS